MSTLAFRSSPTGRVGELALWSSAAVLMLSVHVAGAVYLMRQEPVAAADNQPPAAIMIELAPEPEATNVEEDQVATETQDSQEVKSASNEPEPEPLPEPIPEPIAEPEPIEPPPPQEVAEPVEPEPAPEPIEEIDPIEQQVLAALENVEVPLPVMRPPPPKEKPKPEPKKVEKPEPEKKVVEKPKQRQPQAQKEETQAKLQTRESNRTAASRTSAGSSSSGKSKADWKNEARLKIAKAARRRTCPDTGTVGVRFRFDQSGTITNVSLIKSSGSAAADKYIVSAVQRAVKVPTPPPGVPDYLEVSIECEG